MQLPQNRTDSWWSSEKIIPLYFAPSLDGDANEQVMAESGTALDSIGTRAGGTPTLRLEIGIFTTFGAHAEVLAA